jgi:hypothetical protein
MEREDLDKAIERLADRGDQAGKIARCGTVQGAIVGRDDADPVREICTGSPHPRRTRARVHAASAVSRERKK